MDETEAHVLRMAAIPGAAAHAHWRAKDLEANFPEHAGLVSRVLAVTNGAHMNPPKVYDESNSWRIPRGFGRAANLRTNAQRRKS